MIRLTVTLVFNIQFITNPLYPLKIKVLKDKQTEKNHFSWSSISSNKRVFNKNRDTLRNIYILCNSDV